MSGDARQDSIIFQNQVHLAFEIMRHNLLYPDKQIDYKDVVKLGKRLALNARRPNLDAAEAAIEHEKGVK